jgi:hypothetical protein
MGTTHLTGLEVGEDGLTVTSNTSITGNVTITGDTTVTGTATLGGLRLSDTSWDDLKFPFTLTKQGNTGKPDYDYTNNGLLFPQNDSGEITYAVGQMPHAWKEGTNISPHIHYIQDEAEVPTFKLDYKWYNNGDAVPGSYTTIATTGTPVFTYTSGSILQILSFPDIDGTGKTLSSILDIKVYRDDNDVTGDVLGKEFDIHYEIDSFGSNDEFVKGT